MLQRDLLGTAVQAQTVSHAAPGLRAKRLSSAYGRHADGGDRARLVQCGGGHPDTKEASAGRDGLHGESRRVSAPYASQHDATYNFEGSRRDPQQDRFVE